MPPVLMDPEEESAVLGNLQQLEILITRGNADESNLRLCAGILRFLLMDKGGALSRTAKRWGIKLRFICPDNEALVESAKRGHLFLFSSARFGDFQAVRVVRKDAAPLPNLEATLTLDFDAFKNQRVLFCNGQFITRGETVRYVANKAGAVHWDPEPDKVNRNGIPAPLTAEKMMAIKRIRSCVRLAPQGQPQIFIPNLSLHEVGHLPYSYRQVDLIFAEIFGAASVLLASEDVRTLMDAIRAQLDQL